MRFHGPVLAVFGLACAALIGCGGAGKPPESEASPSADSASDDGAKADAKPADEKPADAKPADKSADGKAADKPAPPADDGPKPSRSPKDILTAPDTLFLFSFNDSEIKQVADDKCSKVAGDDAKKKNECMAKERKNFPPDGHRFKQDQGQWWWITVRQVGNRLVAMHKIPFEFGEETATSITLKPTGKDKGQAPGNVPSKVVFEVPNDYQIALKDPKAGRMVFQAKIGVVSE